MKRLMKVGRFAFILPYILMPIIVMMQYSVPIEEGFAYTFFFFFGIESPFVLLYPICWIISIICFILCAKENKRNQNKKGQMINTAAIILTLLWVVIQAILVIYTINNFRIGF
ncbi:MAG: hypothetical protein E7504_06315 [Ruminococcus sp.]|nr:hypothetical protein [Ruminococcus sp.]